MIQWVQKSLFCHIILEKLLKEIGNLDISKSSQDIDVLMKLSKKIEIYLHHSYESFDNMIYQYFHQLSN